MQSQTDGRVLVSASDWLRRRHLRLLSTVRASWAGFSSLSHLGRRRSVDRRFSVVHQRTLRACRISPCPVRVTRLADPQHRPHCRRQIHTSYATLVSSSLSPILSAVATDGSGTASPAAMRAGPPSASTETRTATGAHPVPAESRSGRRPVSHSTHTRGA